MSPEASTIGGDKSVEELRRELAEAYRREAATAEVLKVISRSAFDLQSVLNTLVESAAKLCEAEIANVWRPAGASFRLAASYGVARLTKDWLAYKEYLAGVAYQPGRGSCVGRTLIERRVVQIDDVRADPEYDQSGALAGVRTMLGVPLLRDGRPIGVMILVRSTVRPFTVKQIGLIETFADQAVIAIENTRLFEEVQTRTNDLQEALGRQTATADVLNVISRSTTNVQPVFNAIVESAAKLFDPCLATITSLEAGQLQHKATASARQSDFDLERVKAIYPHPFDPERSPSSRAILEQRIVEILDTARADAPDLARNAQQVLGFRSVTFVPLIQEGKGIGTIALAHPEAGFKLTGAQLALVQTFADQAVIAIDNAQLFEELQVRNQELRVALEQQTATSEVLSVISRSKFDLQPVFDTIARGAAQLCGGVMGGVFRFDGQLMHVGAMVNFAVGGEETWREIYPLPATLDTATGRAILEKTVTVVTDVQTDVRADWARKVARTGGYRSAMAAPMLREGIVLGAILVARAEPGPFPEVQIELLKTFADQAVIAIENTRLFEEVQARNRDLTALGEVGRAVSSTLDLNLVLKTIVERAVELSGTDAGSIFYYRPQTRRFELGETVGLDEEKIARFRRLDIAADQTGLGEAIAKREPLAIPDVAKRSSNALRDAALEAGLHAALIVPLLGSEGALGALLLQRCQTGEFPRAVVTLMQSFADQSAIALENARLFDEIAQKSRELEIASQHKSQFVANMSHELRTPLAAILGYVELMQEGFYEPLGQKSLDALTRIRANGKHLLGLINTILDIAKIESGQFTLNMAEYAIESVVETVRSATESLAQNKNLILKTEVARPLPVGLGDEQRLTQVLLNLVGNAIKFTDAGEVRIAATSVNGHFNVTVTDTGPGIAEEHQARIFEQFHQVDSSSTKAKGGTGLGLAIAKQIVELHGGRIWVESTLGKGSTFRMELPTRGDTT